MTSVPRLSPAAALPLTDDLGTCGAWPSSERPDESPPWLVLLAGLEMPCDCGLRLPVLTVLPDPDVTTAIDDAGCELTVSDRSGRSGRRRPGST